MIEKKMSTKAKSIRTSPSALFGSLLGFALLVCGLSPQAAEVEELDRIVAVVDEDVIVTSELDAEMLKTVTELRQRGTRMPSREVLEKQVLERLILKKLELNRAQLAGITISEDVLAQTIGNLARQNNMTLSEFRQTLEEAGMSFRGFRESIREQIIVNRLLDQEVRRRIRVTDQEIQAFISREAVNFGKPTDYYLLHILIAVPDGASAEQLEKARTKAEQLTRQLREGLDFRTAALNESDGRQALEGGDLGWLAANQLPTLFADQILQMERNEISDPIRSSSGFHIVMVEDYKGGERKIVNQTKVRHILIRTDEVTADEDARIRLAQLRQRIIGGDDFASLARSHSDDKTSAIEGGELGWVTSGDLVPSFESEINSLEIGHLSEPFRTDFGWHIVEVLDRRQQDSTEAVQKAEAKEAITKRKFIEENALYLRRLRDEAFVDIRLDDNF